MRTEATCPKGRAQGRGSQTSGVCACECDILRTRRIVPVGTAANRVHTHTSYFIRAKRKSGSGGELKKGILHTKKERDSQR